MASDLQRFSSRNNYVRRVSTTAAVNVPVIPEEDPEHEEDLEYLEIIDDSNNVEEEDVEVGHASSRHHNKLKIKWPRLSKHKKQQGLRRKYIDLAKETAASNLEGDRPRKIAVIVNPVSGKGTAKRLSASVIAPMLEVAGLVCDIIETEYAGHATEVVANMDPTSLDGVIIAGGDGLVHEVITGFFKHDDSKTMRHIPVCIAPCGSANAMAHELHEKGGESASSIGLVGEAVLSVCRNQQRDLDVIKVSSDISDDIYCLSMIGWGIAGAVAAKAARLRWIPGQKKSRYDIAGAIMMLSEWPVCDTGKLKFPIVNYDKQGNEVREWVEKDVSTINMICTKLEVLGKGHPIVRGIAPDDGRMAVVIVNSGVSRMGVVRMANAMKKGNHLANNRGVQSTFLDEFILEPSAECTTPFCIDGDPYPISKIHVKVLAGALKTFAAPKAVSVTASVSSLASHQESGTLVEGDVQLADEDLVPTVPVEHTYLEQLDIDEVATTTPTAADPKGLALQQNLPSHMKIVFPKLGRLVRTNDHAQRVEYLAQAMALGEQLQKREAPRRHMSIIYNPVSGRGTAKSILDHMVIPMLDLAGVFYDVFAADEQGFAANLVRDIDPESTDGIIVVGGDGLVHEALCGYYLNEDQENMQKLAIGIVAAGTSNAMAHHMHPDDVAASPTSLVGNAVMSICRNTVREVDVMKATIDQHERYALCMLGWGLAGLVGQQASEMRWTAGRERVRYDVAGYVTMMSHWPPSEKATLKYRNMEKNAFESMHLTMSNFLAVNLPSLGEHFPVQKDVKPDSGNVALLVLDDKLTREEAIRYAEQMKKGGSLGNHSTHLKTFFTDEFMLEPDSHSTTAFNIDGDPYPVGKAHVKVLPRALQLYAQPQPGHEPKHCTACRRLPTVVNPEEDGFMYIPTIEDEEESSVEEEETTSAETDESLESLEQEPIDDSGGILNTSVAHPRRGRDKRRSLMDKLKSSLHGGKHKRRKKCDELMHEAEKIGAQVRAGKRKPAKVFIVYNPVSGKGAAKKVVDRLVVPLLEKAHADFTVQPTKYAGHAVDLLTSFEPNGTDAIIVAGGDGLVQEAVTGYFRNPTSAMRNVGLAIAPSGTANAMAHELHQDESKSTVSLVGHVVLAVCRGTSRQIDVFSIDTPTETRYCLSMMGWGIAGAVAAKAAKLRWIPGQRKARYDIAGAIMMLTNWPITCKGTLYYPVDMLKEDGTRTQVWKEFRLETINMVATNLPVLGEGHPMAMEATPDDGHMMLVMTPPTFGRVGVIRLASAMKHGLFLADQQGVQSLRTREFKLVPDEGEKTELCIDGDPAPITKVHVKMLHQALKVFADPVPEDYAPIPPPAGIIRTGQEALSEDGLLPVEAEDESFIDLFSDDRVCDTPQLASGDVDECAHIGQEKTSHAKWPRIIPHIHTAEYLERREILQKAEELAAQLFHAPGYDEMEPRHILIVYNPVSGKGVAKKLVDYMVRPILEIVGLDYTIVPTEYAGFATEFLRKLDPKGIDGIIISGGDGLVHEVISGYFQNPNDKLRNIPIGICPSGTANAMANELHKHTSTTSISLVGHAALAVCRNTTRTVDVLRVKTPQKEIHCLSVVGWGIAGTVAKKAAHMRWLPGQKSARYSIAGFVSMLKDWPIRCRGRLEYLVETTHNGKVHTSWKHERIATVNMVASNMSRLGSDHPIYPDIKPDEGKVAVVAVDDDVSRRGVVKMAMQMKKGKFLGEQPRHVKVFKTSHFKLVPDLNVSVELNIDGDPYPCSPIDVKVLHRGLTVFAELDHSFVVRSSRHGHGPQISYV